MEYMAIRERDQLLKKRTSTFVDGRRRTASEVDPNLGIAINNWSLIPCASRTSEPPQAHS